VASYLVVAFHLVEVEENLNLEGQEEVASY
jgi:hypothetical protein